MNCPSKMPCPNKLAEQKVDFCPHITYRFDLINQLQKEMVKKSITITYLQKSIPMAHVLERAKLDPPSMLFPTKGNIAHAKVMED